ncbi:MAG: SAM-dependent chlorinase/fluorinase [bacterium]|nr:SAM-dependent chlorinase/fluorinase [bacterium]
MKSKIITLTTDFGTTDTYVSVMKGVILSINPQVTIVDITHAISPQNIQEAAFIFHTAYRYFPKGTIHIFVVDPGVGSERKALLVQTESYYFLAPDNGVLSYVFQHEKIKYVIHLETRKYFRHPISSTFHGRDIFAPVAAHLSLGIPPTKFGPEAETLIKFSIPEPGMIDNRIYAHILHIDHFGNIISDISKEFWNKTIAKKKFVILIGKKKIMQIKQTYAEGKSGELIAYFGSSGYLEIALVNGNAKSQLNLRKETPILIDFK